MDIHKPESATFLLICGSIVPVINHIPTRTHLYKVVVECTTGCLPAAFVADLRQVINHHNAGGVDNVCIEITCQDTCQVPATNRALRYLTSASQFRNLYSAVAQEVNCLVVIATIPHLHTLQASSIRLPRRRPISAEWHSKLMNLIVHTACLGLA